MQVQRGTVRYCTATMHYTMHYCTVSYELQYKGGVQNCIGKTGALQSGQRVHYNPAMTPKRRRSGMDFFLCVDNVHIGESVASTHGQSPVVDDMIYLKIQEMARGAGRTDLEDIDITKLTRDIRDVQLVVELISDALRMRCICIELSTSGGRGHLEHPTCRGGGRKDECGCGRRGCLLRPCVDAAACPPRRGGRTRVPPFIQTSTHEWTKKLTII